MASWSPSSRLKTLYARLKDLYLALRASVRWRHCRLFGLVSCGRCVGLSLVIDAANRCGPPPDLVVHRAQVERDELAVVCLTLGG